MPDARVPLWSRPWFVVLLRVAAALLVAVVLLGLGLNALGGVPAQADFLQFYASALSWWRGQPIYQFFIYIPELQQIVLAGSNVPDKLSVNLNPPVVGFIFLPLAKLELRTAYYLFCTASFVAALLVFVQFVRHCFGHHPALRPAAVVVFTCFFPVMTNLLIGQLGLLLLCCIGLGWLALEKGKPGQAGMWLGLAVLLKLFSGLVLVWLALQRRWTALACASAVYILGMLLAVAVFGLPDHLNWLKAVASHSAGALSWNASLQGVLERYLSAGHGVVSLYNLPWLVFALRVTVWSLSATLLIWLARQPNSFNIGFAAVLPLMLLLAPLGWIYYFPLLLLSAALLWRETASLRLRSGLLGALALAGTPQLLSGGDFYKPSLWRAYDKGGYITTVNGHEEKVLYGTYYWFELPELYTLALITFAVLALCIYRSRSTQTGA